MNKTQLIGHTIEDIKKTDGGGIHIALSSGDKLVIEPKDFSGDTYLSAKCNNKIVEGV